MAGTCVPQPLVLPLRDVQVNATVTDSFMTGIPAQVGTPPQDIVLLPWPELNNTWLYDQQALCDRTVIFSDEICFVRRGNYYIESESSTFKQALDIVSAGGASSETQVQGSELGIKNLINSGLGGTDVFRLGANVSLESFPVGIPRQAWDMGYTTLHALGLGSNSTYLTALLDAGHIGARVWSIFWGRMWQTKNPMNGSIVLGGYDRAKVIGRNLTQNLDFGPSGCWTGMKLNVHDIRVNFRDGSDKTLFQTNSIMPVCLVPQRQLLLEAPSSIFSNFELVTATTSIGLSFGLHWGAQLFDRGTEFDGDITFELDSDFTIRVPNDQYIVPFVAIDRNSSRIFNESQREVLVGALGDQPATLGRYFLTAAYLMVDQDAGTFTLWQANPSTNVDLAVVGDQASPSCSEDSSPAQSSSSSPSSSSSSSSPTLEGGSKSTISGGAIAGAAVGAVAAFAAITVLAFFQFRRKRRTPASIKRTIEPYEMQGDSFGEMPVTMASSGGGTMVHKGQYNKVSSSPDIVYEMDGSKRSSLPR
ncbi:hypothetical protein PV10_05493 [Exophiala mesophila]|uniref:Peptidase A1 domain-containing protein n=1 Tax=Exophiala mesophila TaxID=212818 RepID=A0A0D1ZA78_EXOME|nr:uncharacterized protein PV10_05493 [Exophiala mesophila]KIV90889.1 hypothetical protein PV10_05493 [Exophiala mesophila]